MKLIMDAEVYRPQSQTVLGQFPTVDVPTGSQSSSPKIAKIFILKSRTYPSRTDTREMCAVKPPSLSANISPWTEQGA